MLSKNKKKKKYKTQAREIEWERMEVILWNKKKILCAMQHHGKCEKIQEKCYRK